MKTINNMRQVYFLDDSWEDWLVDMPTGGVIKCDTDRDYIILAELEDVTAGYNCTINKLDIDILSDEDIRIPRLLELLEINMDLAVISGDQALWDEVIHPNMDNPGVLPIPFKRSFNDYSDWDNLWELDKCSHWNFIAWIKSILVSMGHKFYEEEDIDDDYIKITIPGLCYLTVSKEHPDQNNKHERWLDDVKLVEDLDKSMFDCGINLWYDKLGQIALEVGINQEVLSYHMASVNALDIVFYEGDRWMPEYVRKILNLCMMSGFSGSELEDREFMDQQYSNWCESGLLS